MSEFVYLMKNGDLYKIGCTNNLESENSKIFLTKQNLKDILIKYIL